MSKRRIYVASSWRNTLRPRVAEALRSDGHEVYDFRNPGPGNTGFHWSEIDPNWQAWDPDEFRDALCDPIARRGYSFDFEAMQWADTGVLVLPSGRSAHIEAGWMVGAGKPVYILMTVPQEPELMYRMTTAICLSVDGLLDGLRHDDE